MDDNRESLREELEEYLNGLRISGHISRKEGNEVLDDFDTWCETAEIGDTYYYDGLEYTLEEADDEEDGDGGE